MPLPKDKKTVGCKWVFNVKLNSDGSMERYKARLVARGYTQTYGIDYQETFAPVAKLNTIRSLLSIAANLEWPLHQLDVKNAFLNGELEEEVFMDAPPGFEDLFGGNVCRLKKSLYGLKRSPRAWFEKFSKSVKNQGYSQGQSDHTMFIKPSGTGKVAVGPLELGLRNSRNLSRIKATHKGSRTTQCSSNRLELVRWQS
ncbi:Cysteine-rich RLK (receptor-like protein kinase) 8 [Dorcoceras hygrometricum]|uniref:Cysteine-rich RLK (Receptor-like protein kinase) 8 n=1 Tax=Dorcoceras hygrometricum TaxID=472368 RepID=A0A2Z7BXV3_9LAMI|nr:Cysteine-rich RLK (receptor-like protein kinase) 8 [Dorcoceras hygrometricum]